MASLMPRKRVRYKCDNCNVECIRYAGWPSNSIICPGCLNFTYLTAVTPKGGPKRKSKKPDPFKVR